MKNELEELLGVFEQERNASRRVFPYKTGTRQKPADFDKAIDALHVFAAIYDAVRHGHLSPEKVTTTFFQGISDSITYRHSWKCGKFWSVEAWNRYLSDKRSTKNNIISEHVVPRPVALRHALSMPTLQQALHAVWELSFECLITREEDQRLTSTKLKSVGYPEDPWQRYKEADIKILDIEHPRGQRFLNEAERATLTQLGILQSYGDAPCACTHCA